MPDGNYHISVVNYTRRERIDSGFEIEIEIDGQTRHLSMSESPMMSEATAEVAVMTIKGGKLTDFRVERNVSETNGPAVAEQWGLALDAYHEVNVLTISPNYWHGKACGNKHWMLLIDKCQTDETMPGFYNEFLRPDLREHRKVFEVLAERMAIQPSVEQLSGLGFCRDQASDDPPTDRWSTADRHCRPGASGLARHQTTTTREENDELRKRNPPAIPLPGSGRGLGHPRGSLAIAAGDPGLEPVSACATRPRR